jgi:zinc ribbon protein
VYCTKCGAGLAQGAAFCSVCGQTTGGTTPTVASVPVVSGGGPQAWPALPYAGFWLRFVAYLIDGFVVGAGFIAIILVLVMVTGLGSGSAASTRERILERRSRSWEWHFSSLPLASASWGVGCTSR